MAPFTTNHGHRQVSVASFANLLPGPCIHRRPAVCDGAGLNSTAGHSNARYSTMTPLAHKLLAYLREHSLCDDIVSHVAQSQPTHPIAEQCLFNLVQLSREHLHPGCKNPHCTMIAPCQPFCLQILAMLPAASQDPDPDLRKILSQGVPAGVFDEIPSSLQWAQRQSDLPCDAPDDVTLLRCSGNWTRAESNPQVLADLLRAEIEQGWIEEFPGSLEEAKDRWPQRTAVGKLNLVFAEDKEPRLVLDSSVCNANALCQVPEHVSLPAALDVHRTFLCTDQYSSWSALALDVKAARKRIKVRASDQGALLLAWQGKLFYYTVCHFGAKFSAYWWQRIGGQLLRILRNLLKRAPHRAWLYVDDLLALLHKSNLQDHCCLIIAALTILGVPISWCKAQMGASVTWCEIASAARSATARRSFAKG